MSTTYDRSSEVDVPMAGRASLSVASRVERNLAMTPEANDLLASLAREVNRSEGDVLRLALGMFKVAVEARREGKHVGVADSAESLDVELVGF